MLQGAEPVDQSPKTDTSPLVEVQSREQAAKPLGAFLFETFLLCPNV